MTDGDCSGIDLRLEGNPAAVAVSVDLHRSLPANGRLVAVGRIVSSSADGIDEDRIEILVGLAGSIEPSTRLHQMERVLLQEIEFLSEFLASNPACERKHFRPFFKMYFPRTPNAIKPVTFGHSVAEDSAHAG
jgi:hypothetical protein